MAMQKLAALELDFAPPRRNTRAGWIWLMLGLVAAGVTMVQLQTAQSERKQREERLAFLSDKIAGRHPPSIHVGENIDPRAAKVAANIARDLDVPWSPMLASLEGARVKDVSLIGIEPSAARHVIRITAEAKSLEPMLDYVNALRSDAFTQVTLSSHQDEPQTPGTPTRFVVQAQWKVGS
jgi:Tfp pilus assembly protein PilN